MTSLSQQQISELEAKDSIFVNVEGQEVCIERADVEIISEDIPGWTIAQEGSLTVALDIELTPELKAEGLSRLVIKRIQNIRKESGFEITDRIDVVFEPYAELENVIKTYGEHIASQVLANSLTIGDATDGKEQELGDFTARIHVRKVE